MTLKGAADLKGSSYGLLQGPQSCWSTGVPQLGCTGGSDPPGQHLSAKLGRGLPTCIQARCHAVQTECAVHRCTAEEFKILGEARGGGGGTRGGYQGCNRGLGTMKYG